MIHEKFAVIRGHSCSYRSQATSQPYISNKAFSMKNTIYFCITALTFLFTGCASVKDVPYFQNSADFDGSKGATLYDMTIYGKRDNVKASA